MRALMPVNNGVFSVQALSSAGRLDYFSAASEKLWNQWQSPKLPLGWRQRKSV